MKDKLNIKIEEIIQELFEGEKKENFLNFVAYLRTNKLNPSRSSAVAYKINYKGFTIAYIWVNKDNQTLKISPFLDIYDDNALSDEFKAIVWANVDEERLAGCEVCNKCYKFATITSLFGKEYSSICYRAISFTNPTTLELECIKKLLFMKRDIVLNGQAKCGVPFHG